MPGAVKNFIGREGFIWFVGVIEDRNDPEMMGRARVRCFGWHTEDKALIPTEDLPWAHVLQSSNAPSTYAPKEGDYVCGFFMDGDSAQNPVIMGVLPGKPQAKPDYSKGFSDARTDFGNAPTSEPYPLGGYINEPTNSRLARGRKDDTVIETRERNLKSGIQCLGTSWSEPRPTFNPTYPYNFVHETESGHALELDDTKDNERVHLAHKKGTYIEFDKDGNRAEKVVKDNYTVIMGSDYIYVEGTVNVTVGGDCNMKVNGKFNLEAAEINMKAAGAINAQSGSATNIKAGSSFTASAGSSGKVEAGSSLDLNAGSTATLKGSTAKLVGNIPNQVKIPPGTDKPGGIGKVLSA